MTKSQILLPIKYALFAGIATIVNIGSQEMCFRMGEYNLIQDIIAIFSFIASPSTLLYIGAIGFGTLTGLLTKYILDKRYIFYFKTADKKDNAKKFGLYMTMGIITTAIFWGAETAFHVLFDAKYLGAIIGLSIGYISKYFLDKRFVFVNKA